MRRDSTGAQDTLDVVGRHEAARGHDRQPETAHRGQQFLEQLGRRLGRRVERAAMPAGPRPLRRQHVDATRDRLARLRERRHGAHGRDTRLT